MSGLLPVPMMCTRMYTHTYPPHTHIGMPVPCHHADIPSGSPQSAPFASKGESSHPFLFIYLVLTLPRGLGEIRSADSNRFYHGETSVQLSGVAHLCNPTTGDGEAGRLSPKAKGMQLSGKYPTA